MAERRAGGTARRGVSARPAAVPPTRSRARARAPVRRPRRHENCVFRAARSEYYVGAPRECRVDEIVYTRGYYLDSVAGCDAAARTVTFAVSVARDKRANGEGASSDASRRPVEDFRRSGAQAPSPGRRRRFTFGTSSRDRCRPGTIPRPCGARAGGLGPGRFSLVRDPAVVESRLPHAPVVRRYASTASPLRHFSVRSETVSRFVEKTKTRYGPW